MKLILVPIMLSLSSLLMAFAWLGHVRFPNKGFLLALVMSWVLVLPEYVLNVSAIRYGYGVYTGGEMAAFNLGTGVLSVALVSRLFLKEHLNNYQIVGFFLMTWAILLVVYD
ncbi:MAG: DMT family protein [Cyanobacteria bacterium P01_G01_bin.39]